ncbi:mavicyanin [Pistacia vera]|uniref:mavicyanin n=1 Tax=Pistacia vera TaxID=55513 RepID=UPI0012630FEF|nr:mavicyanin [Pistacia vera]
MALEKRSLPLVVMLTLFLLKVSNAAVYKVGDSGGWTTIGNIDYKQWAATKTFQLGDTILFEYNSQFHNVMQVTHAMYRACNASAPLATYTTGNDSITIKTKGHHFFFCGVPGHCQAGQKVDINVLRTSDQPAAAPSGAVSSPPSVPAAKVPGPSPNNAVSLKTLTSLLGKFGLTMVVVLLFLSSGLS